MPQTAPAVVARLAGGLIASCQPVRGGVFDRPELVALFALAALDGGAVGLRVESLADLRAVRGALDAAGRPVPVTGLVKRTEPGTEVFITPRLADVRALAEAGADVIAFDATDRERPVPVAETIDAVHALGALAMADVSTEAEGVAGHAAGADFVATTLSGYVPGTPDLPGPDLDLVARLARAGARVVAEGRVATPVDAAAARGRGAFAVTVGTAFSRPEWIVRAFVDAVRVATATVSGDGAGT
jgi:N-acylglucosamine-6-phosphate 2-epimerase